MFYTGFADEAGKSLAKQIEATKALGWSNIEVRMIDGKFLGMMTDAEFEAVREGMAGSGVSFNCYGSGVANWSKAPRSDADFEETKHELIVAIPRMHALGIKLLRGMSFKLTNDEPFDSPELEKIIFRKVNELVGICKAEGIVYGHENCMNYGGQSYVHTLRLLEHIKYDNFTLIFDTGNPTFTLRRIGEKPYRAQSAWEFYEHVRDHVSYVHIKDSITTLDGEGGIREREFTYPGDGQGNIPEILTDLFKRGYDGGFSMEPHIQAVFHEGDDENDPGLREQRKFETYVEYGRRFEKLVAKCKKAAAVK